MPIILKGGEDVVKTFINFKWKIIVYICGTATPPSGIFCHRKTKEIRQWTINFTSPIRINKIITVSNKNHRLKSFDTTSWNHQSRINKIYDNKFENVFRTVCFTIQSSHPVLSVIIKLEFILNADYSSFKTQSKLIHHVQFLNKILVWHATLLYSYGYKKGWLCKNQCSNIQGIK